MLALVCGSACSVTLPLALADGTPETAKKPVAVIDGKEVDPPAIPMGDPAVVAAILKEGKDNSKVMEHLIYLSQQIGPRLTGSTNAKKSNDWAEAQYRSWGLSNPHIEQYGEIGVGFDRGPSTGKILMPEAPQRRRPGAGTGAAGAGAAGTAGTAGNAAGAGAAPPPADEETKAPELKSVRDMQFTTLAWTRGTDGPTRGPVYWLPKTDSEYLEIKDKLKGAWVLMEPPPPMGGRGIGDRVKNAFRARAEARDKVKVGTDPMTLPISQRVQFDGINGYISTSRDERVWTTAVTGWRELTIDTIPPETSIVVRLSDYDFINSRLADGEEFTAEFDLPHTFTPGPVPIYNTIAEIRGTEKPDEVVIISAHMDTWDGPGSLGTTDNGTGTSVVLEAARILATVGAKPTRTIRFINYTGEEQGLLGSAGYVKDHADEMPKISACFVDDGGTNYQGGLTVPAQMVDYLAAATAATNNQFWDTTDKKFLNVDIKTSKRTWIAAGGSSDHASYNAKGVPGFFWEEVGRADYGYGWHTQNDKLDLAIPMYLAQSATNMAITAYNLACAPELLPRSIKPEEEAKPVEKEKQSDPSKSSASAAGK